MIVVRRTRQVKRPTRRIQKTPVTTPLNLVRGRSKFRSRPTHGRNLSFLPTESVIAEEDSGYHADAVHFDGSTWLKIATGLDVENGPRGIFSFWGWQDVDTTGLYVSVLSIPGPNLDLSIAIEHRVNLTLATSDFGSYILCVTDADIAPFGEWFHVLYSWDTDFVAGSRRVAIYVNDVPQTLTTVLDAGLAFNTNYQGAPFHIGTSQNEIAFAQGSMADLYLDTVNTIVQEDGTILEADRRNFISAEGKPIDLSGFGTPALFLSGDATGFLINQGSGGTVEYGAGALTDADTSPSD